MDRKIEIRWFQRRRNKWIVATAAFLIAISVTGLFSRGKSYHKVDRNGVIIGSVESGLFKDYIALNGKLEPIQTVYLDVLEGGRVDKVVREAGSYVAAGDTIIIFSNASLLLELTSREAQLFEQQNNLRNTRVSMDRYTVDSDAEILKLKHDLNIAARHFRRDSILFENKHIAIEEYEDSREYFEYLMRHHELTVKRMIQDSVYYKDQIEALEKSISRIKGNLALIGHTFDQLYLCAPVSGFLTSQTAELGQLVPPRARIGRIDVLDGYIIKVELDEYYIGQVELGQAGRFDVNGHTFQATVSRIYPEVINGKFTLDLGLADSLVSGMRRGQSLRVHLELSPDSKSVILSKGAFFQSTGGRWVYVLDSLNNLATRRAIRLGRQNPREFEVLEGLYPGEKVILSSYDAFGDVEELILK